MLKSIKIYEELKRCEAKHNVGNKRQKEAMQGLLEGMGIGKQPQLEVSQPLTGQTAEKNWPLQNACITYICINVQNVSGLYHISI